MNEVLNNNSYAPHELEDIKPLSKADAEALKRKLGGINLAEFSVKVLLWQCLTSLLVGLLAWLLSSSAVVTVSAFYGAMCATLPSALVARVVIRRAAKNALTHSGGNLVGLLVLELVKVALTIALLVAAPRLIESPDWIALLAGFVVTLKIYWLVAIKSSLGLLGQPTQIKKLG